MTKKSTKWALLMSIISVLVCCAMLVGATFAWFSDTVSTGVNKIVAGNLKVGLEYDAREDGAAEADWQDAEGENIFPVIEHWEPGMVSLSKSFRVVNLGNLALAYNLSLSVLDEQTPEDGLSLADVIKVAIVPVGTDTTDRQAVIDACAWGEMSDLSADELCLLPECANVFQIALYWEPTDNDNLYNLDEEDSLSIDLGLTVTATQAAYEKDGFGNSYDIMALKELGIVLYQTSEATLNSLNNTAKAALNLKGRTYLLSGDINNPSYCKLKGTGMFFLNGNNIDGGHDTYSLIVEGDITLGGSGKVTNSQGGYGIMVQVTLDTKQANVTIGAGVEVDSLYLIDGAVVTIKSGAVINGYINVGNEETHGYAPAHLIIEDGEAVKGVEFQAIDLELITIPAGYEWVATGKNWNGDEYVEGSNQIATFMLVKVA